MKLFISFVCDVCCSSAGGSVIGPDGGVVEAIPPQKLRVFVPSGSLTSPTMITCRLIAKERLKCPPQLRKGQALASRVVEVTPSALKFRRQAIYLYIINITQEARNQY